MTTRYLFSTDSGRRSPISSAEALEIIGGPNVADGYDVPGCDGEPSLEVYEVYGCGETPDDYPDGDGYADTITMLPVGWCWDRDGRAVLDDD